jgi:hypothetical protein
VRQYDLPTNHHSNILFNLENGREEVMNQLKVGDWCVVWVHDKYGYSPFVTTVIKVNPKTIRINIGWVIKKYDVICYAETLKDLRSLYNKKLNTSNNETVNIILEQMEARKL